MTYDPNAPQEPNPNGAFGGGAYGGGTYGQQQPQPPYGQWQEPAQGQPAYGQPGQPQPGQSYPGQPFPGQAQPGQAHPGQSQAGQAMDGNATYGQAYAQPAYQQQPPKKRGRAKWWIIAAVAVVVLGLGTWGGIALFGKFGGARTPEAAVENYLTSVASFNLVDAALGTAPSEREIFQDAVMQLRDADLGESAGSGDDDAIPPIFDSLSAVQKSVKVTRDGFEYETEEIVEGVEVVTITEGVIVIDGDDEAFRDALVDLARGIRYEAEISSGTSEEEALELALEMTDDGLDVEFPYEYDISDGGEDLQGFPEGLDVVTVQEGSGWYVSQIMTGVNLAATGLGTSLTGTEGWPIGDSVVDAQPAESPEAAGLQLAEGLANYFSLAGGAVDVDIELGIGTMTQAERTLASLYLLPWLEDVAGDASGGFDYTYSITGGFEEFEFGGKTMILPESLEVTFDGETAVELDGYCATAFGDDSACLTDWHAYSELGWDQLGLVVVQEGGGWLVSPYQTVEIYLETATGRYLELREEGNLDVLYG